MSGERQLFGSVELEGRRRWGRGDRRDVLSYVAFAEDAADAGVGVLQVRGGVAVQRQQLVPTENVIALAVGQQVGVFDRADADDAGDFAPRGFGQFRALLRHDFERALLGLVEEVGQLDGLAGAGFEGLAVLAQDGAEPDVGQFDFGLRMPAAEHGEELLEMELLAGIGDIDDLVGAPGLQPMRQGGEVGSGVVEGAVALLNQGGVFLQLRDVLEEDRHGAFALAGDALGAQLLDERLQARMVEALAKRVVEFHAQPLVDRVELDARQGDHLAPDAEVLLVAALEFDQFLPGGFERGGIGFALGADLLVEALHLADGVGLQRGGVQVALPGDQQHAELRAPIAQVIVGDDLVAQQPQRARQAIAQDGRADVADVHGLGHVGRAEIHDHGPRLRGGLKEEVFAARGGLQGLGQRRGFEPEIKEAGAGNLHLLTDIADLKPGDHVGGQLARIHLPGLGERHEGVGLVVAEFRVGHGRTRTVATSASGKTARTACWRRCSRSLWGSTGEKLVR